MAPVDNVPVAVKEIAKHFRPLYSGKFIINVGFTQASGNKVLEDGYADAVAFGKPFISNPDLVERIRRGAKWARWNKETFYTPGAEGYTDYPFLD
jgi:N-ethylmaleimide reductase